ncbi:MAG: ABC transporter ATP-binding protein, partial [Planctomycetaceae bacterium]|nr:ABC transporter ATP-binding protein [Planctomycetaceae bacterium]
MSEIVIRTEGLGRRFRRHTALDDVNFQLQQGSVLGLVGENGAGKTTLIRHFLGMLRPTSGTVQVFGTDPVADPAGVLSRIGYLSEDRDMPPWMRIKDYLSFRAAFYPAWDHACCRDLVERFALDEGQKISQLSRGQLARLGLISAVAHRPELLLLDEPSSGLDPAVRHDILSTIIRTVANEGRTVLFSSHLLAEVQQVCDHVALLVGGQMPVNEPIDDFLRRHRRWTIRLSDAHPQLADLPCVLRSFGDDQEKTVLTVGDPAPLRDWVQQHQAQVLAEDA